MTDTRRFFNSRERLALYQAANGKCQMCGKPLDASFHADHVQPYSAGGLTDVLNGQALCDDCNLKKGTRMPENKIVLRQWQQAAYNKFLSENKPRFLTVACTGAGKSKHALSIGENLIASKKVRRMLIGTPGDPLKEYWKDEAANFGIQLNRDWNGYPLVNGFHGIVATFAAIGANPDQYRKFCAEEPTFVIIDEAHHLAAQRNWGDGAIKAFDPAAYILSLSGTPFRSDNLMIPFFEYPGGVCKADVSYGYAEGLRDGILAPIYFPAYGGQVEWLSNYKGRVISASFQDDLNDRLSTELLNAALDLNGNWLPDTFREANRKLNVLRKYSDPNAAGIIFATSVLHAKGCSDMVVKETGETPVLVAAEIPGSSEAIKAFRTSHDKWIIAVNMISEGVDIPRLRVGVWATNVSTELAFRQRGGRLIRIPPGVKDPSCYLYIPDVPLLVSYALKMKEERVHILGEEDGIDLPDETGDIDEWDGPEFEPRKKLTVLDSWAEPGDVIFNGESFGLVEQAQYEQIVANSGLADTGIEPVMVGLVIREWQKMQGGEASAPVMLSPAPQVATVEAEKPLHDRIIDLRNYIHERVKEYVRLQNVPYDAKGEEISKLHTILKNLTGNWLQFADIDELEQKREIVNGWIEGWKNAHR